MLIYEILDIPLAHPAADFRASGRSTFGASAGAFAEPWQFGASGNVSWRQFVKSNVGPPKRDGTMV